LEAVRLSRQIAKLQVQLQDLLEEADDAKSLMEARKSNRGKKGYSVSETREILGL
jgi:hypothetical protein